MNIQRHRFCQSKSQSATGQDGNMATDITATKPTFTTNQQRDGLNFSSCAVDSLLTECPGTSGNVSRNRTASDRLHNKPSPSADMSSHGSQSVLASRAHYSGPTSAEVYRRGREDSASSIVDGLLCDIYDRWHYSYRDSIDSDTFSEYSSTSDVFFGRQESLTSPQCEVGVRYNRTYLLAKDVWELRRIRAELQHRTAQLSARLIRQLKRRDRRRVKRNRSYDLVTAIIQASSLKRREDSKIRFSLEPVAGDDAFRQWKDAMKAVARLPGGIPPEFRKTVWLSLADSHIKALKVCWDKTCKFAFNDRSNPDDNKLGLQIVKDLHRTGCSGFSGQDNDEERAVLKRVLLAYARWNKQVGYCQGFNLLAALMLEVTQRREDHALKVMIYLVDHVLPESYFANNLRALSVDMAVFRDLLRSHLPHLSSHLDHLQASAGDDQTGANYEPPLTNVFTMQWFLTLFATCLPKATALRVWDSVMLHGSEVLLRTALAVWEKLQHRILGVHSADDFYTTMGVLTQEMLDTNIINPDDLVKRIYNMAPFPFPQLSELREKYTYNITPFSAAMSTGRKPKSMTSIFSDDDELDDDDLVDNVNCFTGIFPPALSSPSKSRAFGDTDPSLSASNRDISKLSPGAYAAQSESQVAASNPFSERMSTDLTMLRHQYRRLRARQKQASIILATASARHHANLNSQPGKAPFHAGMAQIESPVAVNHLFIGRKGALNKKNKTVTEAPKISPIYTVKNLVKQPSPVTSPSPEQRGGDGEEERAEAGGEASDGSTCEVESDYTCVESTDTDIASLHDVDENKQVGVSDDVFGEGREAESASQGTLPPHLHVEDCSGEELPHSSPTSPSRSVPRPGVLPLTDPCSSNGRLSPRQDFSASSPQQDILLSRTPSPEHHPDSDTDQTPEYIAHLTYKTHKNNHAQNGSRTPSPNAKKVFNPFSSQHISKRRLQNGIRLGLYSLDAVPKIDALADKGTSGPMSGRPVNSSCNNSRYRPEVKQKTNGPR